MAKSQYAEVISKLEPNLQRFFGVDFPSKEYTRAKEAILRCASSEERR